MDARVKFLCFCLCQFSHCVQSVFTVTNGGISKKLYLKISDASCSRSVQLEPKWPENTFDTGQLQCCSISNYLHNSTKCAISMGFSYTALSKPFMCIRMCAMCKGSVYPDQVDEHLKQTGQIACLAEYITLISLCNENSGKHILSWKK